MHRSILSTFVLCLCMGLWSLPSLASYGKVTAQRGSLRLSGLQLESSTALTIDGEWSIAHPYRKNFYGQVPLKDALIFELVSDERIATVEFSIEVLTKYYDGGFAIQLPFEVEATHSFRVETIDGKPIWHQWSDCHSNVAFIAGYDRFRIVLRAMNTEDALNALRYPISIGRSDNYSYCSLVSSYVRNMLYGAFFITMVFLICYFSFMPKDMAVLYLTLFMFFILLASLTQGSLSVLWLNLSDNALTAKLSLSFWGMATLPMLYFLQNLFQKEPLPHVCHYFTVAALLSLVVLWAIPSTVIYRLMVATIYGAMFLYYSKRYNDVLTRLAFLFSLIMLSGALLSHSTTYVLLHQFSLLVFTLLSGILFAFKLYKVITGEEAISEKYEEITHNLNKIIEEKTTSLTDANTTLIIQMEQLALKNEELEEYHSRILSQKNELEKQHLLTMNQLQLIERQNETIRGNLHKAKRIQRAVLTPRAHLYQLLGDHLFFFLPKEIVSGDFHWSEEKDGLIYLAVADCTGHGVPGALISMLGVTLLREIVHTHSQPNSADILQAFRQQIKISLRQTGRLQESRDAINIGLAIIDKSQQKLHYTGARMDLYCVRKKRYKNELISLKGDNVPIGIFQKGDEQFTTTTLNLTGGDTIYLCTDGFQDQIGVLSQKKYSSARLKRLLKDIGDKTFEEQRHIFSEEFLNWKGNEAQLNDILVMGFRPLATSK